VSPSAVAEVARPQPVLLRGRVLPGPTLPAPLSGRRCVLYRVELSVLRRLLALASARPTTETAGTLFAVAAVAAPGDPPLAIVVDARAVERLALPRQRFRLPRGENLERDRRLGLLFRRLARRRAPPVVRCSERRLQIGDRLEIEGWIQHSWSPSGAFDGYRRPPRQPRLVAREVRLLRRRD